MIVSDEIIEAKAGFLSSRPLDLRDVEDQPITSSLPDPSRFTAYATGEIEINSEMREITIPQTVDKNENDQFSVSTAIKSAGTFKLYVLEGTTGIQTSFKNLPLR